MTEELRRLFSLKIDPVALSAINSTGASTGSGAGTSTSASTGSASGGGSGAVRTAQDIMNSYATRSEEELFSGTSSRSGGSGSTGGTSGPENSSVAPVDAKSKCFTLSHIYQLLFSYSSPTLSLQD